VAAALKMDYPSAAGPAAAGAAGGAYQAAALERVAGTMMEQLAVSKELAKEAKVTNFLSKELAKEAKELAKEAKVTNFLLRKQATAQFKYTSSQATQYRVPGFKNTLIQEYGCEDPDYPGKLCCMALGQYVPKRLVCAAHLFKYAWRTEVSQVLGFHNINDAANGLLLIKPIEEAFDNGYMCFTWEGSRGADRLEGQYRMHWLGDAELLIQNVKHYPWKTSAEKLPAEAQAELRALTNESRGPLRFMDFNAKALSFNTDARPYRRCLIFQARFALKQALGEGRITQQQLAKTQPYLLSMSPQASNMAMFWQTMPNEDFEVPLEPAPVEDLIYDYAPECPSDEEDA
jgi:hypothetical protein